MHKLLSLVRVNLKDNFSLFKIENHSKNKVKKFVLPFLLVLSIFLAIGYYSYIMAEPLHQINMTYVVISLWIIIVSILTLMEGIYKSQGILFENKDNDLLMSLPIKKSTILASRIIKLILFQIMYDALFIVPTLIIYAIFENPTTSYYIMSLILIITLPIIPTVISSIIGMLIKSSASHFKNKKFIQTILSIIVTIGLLYVSFNINNLGNNLINNASSINQTLVTIYYPVKLYLDLIRDFNWLNLLKLLGLNLGFIIIFIYIMSLNYYQVLQKNSDNIAHKSGKFKMGYHSPSGALIKKEFKRYISSPMYVMNTIFGLVFLLGLTIFTCFKPDVLSSLISFENIDANQNISIIYLGILIFMLSMTSITCACISLEGKSFNLTKSLPISIKDILLAKLKFSLLVIYPFVLLSDIIFILKFKISFLYIIIIFLISILVPLLIQMLGMLINLKFPKMNFSSDTEVVKQSVSTMISIYSGMAVCILIIVIYTIFIDHFILALGLIFSLIIVGIILLYQLLMTYGVKAFKNINV